MSKKTLGIIAGVLIAVAPLVSSAAGLAPFEGNSVMQAEGTIQSVDQAKHTVTVLDQHGGEGSFTVTETGNFAQIKPGAKVHVRMIRSALVSPSNGADASSSTPMSLVAVVQAIDHASGVLELKGPTGAVFHIQSRDPGKLADVKPGMQLKVAYAQPIRVAVDPAQ